MICPVALHFQIRDRNVFKSEVLLFPASSFEGLSLEARVTQMPSPAAVLPTIRPPDRVPGLNLFGQSGADRCATPLYLCSSSTAAARRNFIKQASSPLTCRC
jgi:hypothetical protein